MENYNLVRIVTVFIMVIISWFLYKKLYLKIRNKYFRIVLIATIISVGYPIIRQFLRYSINFIL
jgi:hypothetical protein